MIVFLFFGCFPKQKLHQKARDISRILDYSINKIMVHGKCNPNLMKSDVLRHKRDCQIGPQGMTTNATHLNDFVGFWNCGPLSALLNLTANRLAPKFSDISSCWYQSATLKWLHLRSAWFDSYMYDLHDLTCYLIFQELKWSRCVYDLHDLTVIEISF